MTWEITSTKPHLKVVVIDGLRYWAIWRFILQAKLNIKPFAYVPHIKVAADNWRAINAK